MMGINDRWIAYQFDSAVTLVGSAIENASQELKKVGSGDAAQLTQKYTMKQLLDPDFRLPLNSTDERPIETDIKGVQGVLFDEVP